MLAVIDNTPVWVRAICHEPVPHLPSALCHGCLPSRLSVLGEVVVMRSQYAVQPCKAIVELVVWLVCYTCLTAQPHSSVPNL